jgi:monovalent cation/hydrogen antiporter
VKKMEEKYSTLATENALVGNLKRNLTSEADLAAQKLEALECDEHELQNYNQVLRDLIQVQRQELFQLRREKVFEDECIRSQEAQLDLDESKISDET